MFKVPLSTLTQWSDHHRQPTIYIHTVTMSKFKPGIPRSESLLKFRIVSRVTIKYITGLWDLAHISIIQIWQTKWYIFLSLGKFFSPQIDLKSSRSLIPFCSWSMLCFDDFTYNLIFLIYSSKVFHKHRWSRRTCQLHL